MYTPELAIKHFRFIEGLGLFILLCAWLFNSWSIENWSDASSTLRDKYNGVESMMKTVQTMNVIRYEGAVTRQVQRSNLRAQANSGDVMAVAWKSAEVRQLRVTMTGLIVKSLELFLEEIEPLIDTFDTREKDNLKQLKLRVDELKKELHSVMPTEKDIPLTQATVPNPSVFTLEAAEKLDKDAQSVVTLTLEARQRIADYILAEKQKRSSMANWFFIIGSILVATAKVIEWRIDVGKKVVEELKLAALDERQQEEQNVLPN